MTDRATVTRWLEEYVDAWRSYNRDAIGALFAKDARYRFHPFDEWIRGRDAIVDAWLDEPDEPGTYDAGYQTVAVDGEVAVATGTSTYTRPEAVYDNCFVMRFDADGLCVEFTEWFVERPEGAGDGASQIAEAQ